MAKVLLVEDNEMNRDMLGRRLQRRGFELVIAIDGEEGLAKAGSEQPDIILMDMSLPGIDGDVWRSLHIRYRYTDLEGQVHEAEAEDLKARCILHEVDHLDGVLFIDRMVEEARRKLAGKLALLRKSRGERATGTD